MKARWSLQRSGRGTVVSLIALLSVHAFAEQQTRNVLALYANARTLPANIEADHGLRAALADTQARHVEVYSEFLDVPRFSGPSYAHTVATFLGNKYAEHPPDVIFIGGSDALAFALVNRSLMFPTVPMVHAGVPTPFLKSLGKLPADVIGDPMEVDSLRTIELAFRLHPKATQLILVTGAGDFGKAWETRLRDEAPRFPSRATPHFFAKMPTETLRERLAALTGDAVVFTPGYFIDGDGHGTTPHDAATFVASIAAAPVYGPYATFIDTGVVGGYAPNFYEIAYQAGGYVNAVLDGADPASMSSTYSTPTALNIDWRQVERWGIEPNMIPKDAYIQFREPSLFEAHRVEVFTAAGVIVLQSALIISMFVERRRRHAAERLLETRGLELAHTSRVAIAGELTASIAHEINQPLGAILSNADTGELILESDADRRDDLRAIFADIRRDDLRASEVIRRLRTLLDNHQYERAPFQINDVVSDVSSILSVEARRRGMMLDIPRSSADATVVGDRIQITQVLINLVLNAMDAVCDLPEERRWVVVSTHVDGDRVTVEVLDRGNGIAPEHLPQLFDSFFTTKLKGMGLGLSIARTLVTTHGGRIWAENRTAGGAIFRVELPVLTSAQGAANSA